MLIGDLDKLPFLDQLHRKVQHYGHQFDYRSKDIDKEHPLGELPSIFDGLLGNIGASDILPYKRPNQITVNEYVPGMVGCVNHSLCVLMCFICIRLSLSSPSFYVFFIIHPSLSMSL
jgi:hypothetical protein